MARSARGRQPSWQPREAAGGLTARRGWTSLVRERMAGKCERRDWNPRAGIPEAGSTAPCGLHPSLARHRHGSHTGCCRADDLGFRAPRPLGPRPAPAAWPAERPPPPGPLPGAMLTPVPCCAHQLGETTSGCSKALPRGIRFFY